MSSSIILLSLITIVTSFGVSNFYYANNPLKMQGGETKEVTLLLQNMVGKEDFQARATIVSGSEIAKITDTGIYQVPAETKDVPIKVVINTPKKAKVGEKYEIKIEVVATPKNSEGTITLSQGIATIIPIEIIKKETSSKIIIIIITIIAIILACAILYILHRKSLKRGGFYEY